MVGGKKQSIRVLRLLSVLSILCVVVSCHDGGGFQQHFVGWNSPGTLLQGFKCLNIHIWVNGLTIWHNVCQNYSFRANPHPLPPKNGAVTFPAEGVALNFLSEEKMDDVLPLSGCPWVRRVPKRTEYESLLFFLDEFFFLTERSILDPFSEMWE